MSIRSVSSLWLEHVEPASGVSPIHGVSPEHRAVRDIPRDKSSVPTAAVDKEHLCPPLLRVCCSLMCIPVSADLLFGLPGRYSGVNLYNRRRVVSYTVTLGLQRYDSR